MPVLKVRVGGEMESQDVKRNMDNCVGLMRRWDEGLGVALRRSCYFIA